jgi:coproporphyrinogen III oxidase-like Fe-S oxidoreductase
VLRPVDWVGMIDRLLTRILRRESRERMRLLPLEPGSDLLQPAPGKAYLLYVHVPFCEVLCPFCSFHRVEFQPNKAARYFRALRREIESVRAAGFDIRNVYVGGGTPTVATDELAETLALIRSRFAIRDVSVETNPNDLRDDVLAMLAAAGVTRLSVGVQSFDDRLLKAMDRFDKYGSSAQIRERLAAAHGRLPTINVDMIFNLPQQTLASIGRDLAILVDEIRADQVSFYPLMVAPTTRTLITRRMGRREANHERAYYELIRRTMSRGYRPSSVWCFSRGAAMADEYLGNDDEFIGVGSGAFSYLNGSLLSNTFSLNRYARLGEQRDTALVMGRRMSLREQMQYDFLVKLFAMRLDKAYMAAKYGGGYRRALWKEINGFKLLGAIREDADAFRPTERGMYCFVVMMREFLNGVNRFREQLRAGIRREYAVDEAGAELEDAVVGA